MQFRDPAAHCGADVSASCADHPNFPTLLGAERGAEWRIPPSRKPLELIGTAKACRKKHPRMALCRRGLPAKAHSARNPANAHHIAARGGQRGNESHAKSNQRQRSESLNRRRRAIECGSTPPQMRARSPDANARANEPRCGACRFRATSRFNCAQFARSHRRACMRRTRNYARDLECRCCARIDRDHGFRSSSRISILIADFDRRSRG